MSMKLDGPAKSKVAIESFKKWLLENCKTKQPYAAVLGKYQLQTGHAYRRLQEWLKSLEQGGVIKIFENSGSDYIIAVGNAPVETQEKPTKPASKKLEDKDAKNMRNKLKMMKGPCKNNECPPFTEKSCENCSVFMNLKDKSFLEEE